MTRSQALSDGSDESLSTLPYILLNFPCAFNLIQNIEIYYKTVLLFQPAIREEKGARRCGQQTEERSQQDRRHPSKGRDNVRRVRGRQDEGRTVPETVRGILGRHCPAEARG